MRKTKKATYIISRFELGVSHPIQANKFVQHLLVASEPTDFRKGIREAYKKAYKLKLRQYIKLFLCNPCTSGMYQQ